MGSKDMEPFEKGKEEKVEEGKDKLNEEKRKMPGLVGEISSLIVLAIPLFLSSASWVGMKATDTALLGHLQEEGTTYLSAVAVADLWTSPTGVFIQGRVLGTFVGHAVGAGKPEMAGVWTQVSLVCIAPLALIPLVLWSGLTSSVLPLITSDQDLIGPGSLYAGILAIAIPGRVLFSQFSQYLTARGVMHPSTISAVCALVTNLCLGLFFVLGLPEIPGFAHKAGFPAAAPTTVVSEYVQGLVLLLLGFVMGHHHRGFWPTEGWSFTHLTKERIFEFYKLYLPSALAIASDFWRVTVIGVIAANRGSVEVAVFNVAYRFLWICLMFSGAMARASGIRMAVSIGKAAIRDAQYTAKIGLALVTAALIVLAAVVFFRPAQLAAIFAKDPTFIERVAEARLPLAALVLTMNLTVALEALTGSLGKTRHILVCGLIGSWIGQVPACLLISKFWQDDIVGLFWGMAIGYGLHCLALIVCLTILISWEECVEEAQKRNKSSEREGEETQL